MLLRSLRGPAAAAVCLLLTVEATGQNTALTIDDIYSYEGWLRFNGSPSAMITWAPDGDPWVNDNAASVAVQFELMAESGRDDGIRRAAF